MEEVSGVAGAVPPLISYPEKKIRSSLPPDEWQACLDMWLFSLEFRLRLPDHQFEKLSSSQPAGLAYLKSYVCHYPASSHIAKSSKEAHVHQRSYLLLKRLFLSTNVISELSPSAVIDFVVNGSVTFSGLADWPLFIAAFRQRFPKQLAAGLEHWKAETSRQFNSSDTGQNLRTSFNRINSLLRLDPQTGVQLMTGSDYLESLSEFYRHHSGPSDDITSQQLLTEHLYHCLRSLMSDKTRHPSLLLDHLYLLRSEADRLGMKKAEIRTILASLLCSTSFLRHLAGDAAIVDSKRGADILDALLAYREQTRQLFPAPVARKRVAKGKGHAHDSEELHMHQAAQVSQIHELFPDLPTGYILRLLDHFSNDVEQVTAALLEPSSLPADLQDSRSAGDLSMPPPDLAPRSTPPPITQRRNVFDNDDFDRLRISSRNLHRGRKEIKIDEAETAEEHTRSKAAIMAALSKFDSDDDERDDTYDVADVGGTVDRSVDTDNRPRGERAQEQNPQEEVLYRAWKDSAAFFARDSQTRISKVRQDLKRQTAMSDEQIEGWAIMLNRDPALQRRLQQRYSAVASFQGNQRGLEQTRWQQNTSGDNSMDEGEAQGRDTGHDRSRGGRLDSSRGRGRGGFTFVSPAGASSDGGRGRGRGRGRGGGGGRANHSRREGRARKMGRGMGGAPGAS